jgi:hypothetical protein
MHEAIKLDKYGEATGSVPPPSPPPKHPAEESLETALIRHLSWATGMDLVFVCRARQLHRLPDVFATDVHGRLHVFELKKATADRQAAVQLAGYLAAPEKLFKFARKVLGDGSTFDAGMADWQCTAALLAGLRAGKRASTHRTKGRMREVNRVVKQFPDWPWKERRSTYRAAAALGLGTSRLLFEMGDLKARAEELSASLARLRGGRPPEESKPPVGWLVAPHITKPAVQHLRSAARPEQPLRTLRLSLVGTPGNWTLVKGASDSFDGTTTE